MDEKFLNVVAESLEVDVDEISMATEYKNFEPWDSMAMMSLLMDIEEEFNVSIPIEKIGKVKNLQDLFNLLKD
ncbi:MAG: phosphopantetheine-binding protein [Ruminococcus sp.]|jgi:acyl carrier protein|nr:phosphopantetheine-binding protein [Ruminococcus sp.]